MKLPVDTLVAVKETGKDLQECYFSHYDDEHGLCYVFADQKTAAIAGDRTDAFKNVYVLDNKLRLHDGKELPFDEHMNARIMLRNGHNVKFNPDADYVWEWAGSETSDNDVIAFQILSDFTKQQDMTQPHRVPSGTKADVYYPENRDVQPSAGEANLQDVDLHGEITLNEPQGSTVTVIDNMPMGPNGPYGPIKQSTSVRCNSCGQYVDIDSIIKDPDPTIISNTCPKCGENMMGTLVINNPENITELPINTPRHNKYDIPLMRTAEIWAQQSSCRRLKVGAVLAVEGRVIMCGYNGTVSGTDNCCEEDANVPPDQTSTKANVLHAEKNVILFCAKKGISTEGATLYVTHNPCQMCAAIIAQSGIKRVVYNNEYRDTSGIEELRTYGVVVDRVEIEAKLAV